MAETIVASMAALASVITALYAFIKIKQAPSGADLAEIEERVQRRIKHLEESLSICVEDKDTCERERERLKAENFKLYQKLYGGSE